jgi:hypothetical protein
MIGSKSYSPSKATTPAANSSQKRLVRAEVQASLSPLGRKLLALDDPRNDKLSAMGSGASGFMK